MIDTKHLRHCCELGNEIDPATVIELLDRLQEAESDAESMHNVSQENSIIYAELNKLEKERAKLIDVLREHDTQLPLKVRHELRHLIHPLDACADIKTENV